MKKMRFAFTPPARNARVVANKEMQGCEGGLNGKGSAWVGAVILTSLLGATSVAATSITYSEAYQAVLQGSEEADLLDVEDGYLQALKQEAWSTGFPQVSAYARAGRGQSPIDPAAMGFGEEGAPIINPELTQYSYGLEIQQSLFSFGRLTQAIKVARQRLDAQASTRTRTEQELGLHTLDAFFGVWTAQARFDVLDASVKRQSETVAFLESNFGMGSGAKSTVLLATAASKALEPEVLRADRDAAVARMSFNRLMGKTITDTLILDTASIPEFAIPELGEGDGWISAALQRREDLKSLKLMKEATFATADGMHMLYRPSLGFSGKVGILAYDPDQLGDFGENVEYNVGIGLHWPLFDGFGVKAKSSQIRSEARKIELQERQALKMAVIGMKNSRREAEASEKTLEASRQARTAAFAALEMISEDFRAGKGTVTDLLAAEETLRNSEFGLLAARLQAVRSKAALRFSLGLDLMQEAGQ
jgi:outer membrane protein TolC